MPPSGSWKLPSAEGQAETVPTPGRHAVEGHVRQDLGQGGWEVASCSAGACEAPPATEGLEWLPARVPGTAAGALREAGRWTAADTRDLDAEEWWFRTTFEAEPVAPGEEVLLRLDGVATVYEVFLNGERIATGDSMYAPAAIAVGSKLGAGENRLAIRCLALGSLLGTRKKPRARWRAQLADNRLRFFRTSLLGRCRGFAPRPAAVGPYRPVWLERRRLVAVDRLELDPSLDGDDGVVAVRGLLRGLGDVQILDAKVTVDGSTASEAGLDVVPTGAGFAITGATKVPSVRRWWPHTHGAPALYEVTLNVVTAAGEIAIAAGRVGFRTLAAGATPGHDVEVDGLDLHVNGVRTFVRGAVWTPVDFVTMTSSPEELREALEQVRDAGMNMLRLQGTGAYEAPEFHDLCDELGILVWQDFSFANFDYPIADDHFRETVVAEASTVLAALAGRPSLAVLCGNNEVEQQAAMLGLDPDLGRNELFATLLPEAAAEAPVDAVYLRTAPLGGALPFRPGLGISNYFGVGGYRRPLSDARLSGVRFAAECLAFANVPDPSGIDAIAPGQVDLFVHEPRWKSGVPRDAGAGWDFDDIRDHYFKVLLGLDPGDLRTYHPDRYLQLSRAVTGLVMSAVFAEWRRVGSKSGGGLILWLRDLLPGAGWGLVDRQGAPKAVLRALARTFAPVAVWLVDEGLGGVWVHVANDGPERLTARLRVALYDESSRLVGETTEELELDPHGGTEFDLEGALGRFVDASWSYRFGVPSQNLIVATLEDRAGGEILSQDFYYPAGLPTTVETVDSLGLRGECRQEGDAQILEVTSDRLVWGVQLIGDGLLVEDDHFSLEPGVGRKIRWRRRAGAAADGAIRVGALNMMGTVPFHPSNES
jgi:beta-mannosidase